MQDKTCFLTSNAGENNAMLLCFSDHLFNQKSVSEKKSLGRVEYVTMKMCRTVATQ